jgi:hypothetical protein
MLIHIPVIKSRPFYLVNAAEEDVGVPLRGPEGLEALCDIAAGGKVEEDLRVHRPCSHTLPRLSCVNGHRVTRIVSSYVPYAGTKSIGSELCTARKSF